MVHAPRSTSSKAAGRARSYARFGPRGACFRPPTGLARSTESIGQHPAELTLAAAQISTAAGGALPDRFSHPAAAGRAIAMATLGTSSSLAAFGAWGTSYWQQEVDCAWRSAGSPRVPLR